MARQTGTTSRLEQAAAVAIFTYGSNMASHRMTERAPSARVLGSGRLTRHALRFHKTGRDGSGKADAFFTGRSEDAVWGVVYEISAPDKARLDLIEGLGRDYFEREVTLSPAAAANPGGVRIYTASMQMIDGRLRPYPWYKALVLEGAREHGLPADYVASLETVVALEADSF